MGVRGVLGRFVIIKGGLGCFLGGRVGGKGGYRYDGYEGMYCIGNSSNMVYTLIRND